MAHPVVIPVYGQAARLGRLLDALGDEFPLILVDDASPDPETRELVRAQGRRDGVTVVVHEENRGFPAAANAGAARVEDELFFLLNTDVVPEAGWAAALVARMDRQPRAAAVGARLLFPDGVTVQHAGVDFRAHDGLPEHIFRYFSRDAVEVARPRELAMVTHAVVLLRTAAFRAVDGYDEAFGLGMYEDCDLALRQREAGWHAVYEPAAVLIHEEHASFRARDDMTAAQEHGKELFLKRWVRTGNAEELRLNRVIVE